MRILALAVALLVAAVGAGAEGLSSQAGVQSSVGPLPNHTHGTGTNNQGGDLGNVQATSLTTTAALTGGTTANLLGPILAGPTGGMGVANGMTNGAIAVNMLNVEGAAISSGSFVVVDVSGSGANDVLTFARTAVSAGGNAHGVTATSCASGAVCPIYVAGLVRVQCLTGLTVGNHLTASTTLGVASHIAAVQSAGSGTLLRVQTTGGNGWCTALLGWML